MSAAWGILHNLKSIMKARLEASDYSLAVDIGMAHMAHLGTDFGFTHCVY